jgi:hypothetical protein
MQKNINKLETQSEENQDANLQPKNNVRMSYAEILQLDFYDFLGRWKCEIR